METNHILGLWTIVLIAWLVFSIFKTEISHKPTREKDIYDVELYFENGELFKQYSNVYVTHWDNNIYIFKNESINELVHKGENMTLIRKKIATKTNDRWENGTKLASQDEEYMEFVKECGNT